MEDFGSLIMDDWWRRAIVFHYGENPDDSDSIENLIKNIQINRPIQAFNAALAIGLALQATYLVEVRKKIPLLTWVIETISRGADPLYQNQKSLIPLKEFIGYYLFGRDAVACATVSDYHEEVYKTINSQDILFSNDKDLKNFWFIVGLIECGDINTAENYIKKFKPKDLRLLLAIHLGCFLIQNLRVTSKEEKKVAKDICERLSPKIEPLRKELINELKSEILEVRRGKIKSISNE